MNNLVPLNQEEPPDPPVRKPSRKKRRENAEKASHEMGLTNCPPGLLTQISSLGLFVDDLGANVPRGMLVEAYDSALRALKDLEVQMAAIDELPVQTPEDKDRRILLMRVRLDYNSQKSEIATKLLKSKPEEVKETTHTKSVQSFPANAPIPPMIVTETLTIKETGTG